MWATGTGPKHVDIVGRDFLVGGYERQLLDLRLRNEQAIEGVVMVERQVGGSFRSRSC